MARHFDGTNQGIVLANESSFDFDIDDPFSVIFWQKTTIAAGAFDWLMAKSDAGGNGTWYTAYNIAEFMEFVVNPSASALVVIATTSLINTDVWKLLGATFEGNSNFNGMRVYFNGALEATGTPFAMVGTILNNEDMRYANSTVASLDYEGDLFGCCVLSVQATAQQQLSIFHGIPPIIAIPYADLVSDTPLFANQTPEPDYIRQNNTGTVTGATRITPNPPVEHIENYLN